MSLTKKKYEAIVAYSFLAPNLIGYFLFFLLPLAFSFVLAFSQWNFMSGIQGIQFVGLRNFLEMPGDRWFTDSFWNTIRFTVITVPSAMILGLLAATALNEGAYGAKVIRTMFFMPHITSLVAVATVWLALFHPSRGPINNVLRSLGIENPPLWIASSDWSLISIIIASVWAAVGYQMLIYLAGLQGISKDLYESADIDGANGLQKFFRITLPLLTPTTIFLLMTTMIGSLQVFAQVNLMTQGGPGTSSSVIVFYVYRSAFQFYRMGYASAMAWVLFVLIFFVTYLNWQLRKKLLKIF
ncbi:MAG: sugar ABC transporter permease [Spirochaetaceae bacterium]|nr:MAG: sugar ABC transporter permease [Spirochaetaceae bacterium]